MTKTKSISITASLSIGIILVVVGLAIIHLSTTFTPHIPTLMIVGLGITAFGVLQFFVKFW